MGHCKVPSGRRAGACPRRGIWRGPQIFCLPEPLIRAPVPKSRPPSRAGHFPGGVHAAPTGNGTLRGKHQNHACQTAPRRGQDPRGGVKTPPYGFTEIANKIVNTNSRQVVAAARKFPACRDVARRGQDTRPTNLRNLRTKMANCKFPSGRRAGFRPRRANLSCPQCSRLPPHPRRGLTEIPNKRGGFPQKGPPNMGEGPEENHNCTFRRIKLRKTLDKGPLYRV